VRTLTRSDWSLGPRVPTNGRYFGNLPADIPTAAVQGTDVLVHCAALADGKDRAAYAVNVLGTSRLAEMACQFGRWNSNIMSIDKSSARLLRWVAHVQSAKRTKSDSSSRKRMLI